MNTRKTTSMLVSTVLMFVALTVSAQEGVQNLAIVANGLEDPGTLSIIDLDEPDVKQAVENEIIPLGSAPSDVQVQDDLAYVVNTFSNNVQVIDLRNRMSLGTIPIGDGTLPQKVAFVGRSKAYVTCNGTDDIRVVDVRQRRVVNTIPGGLKPTGIATINGKAYVTNSAFVVDPVSYNVTYEDSSVTVIDIQTDRVLEQIPVPTNATDITTDGESKVLVLSAGDFGLIPGTLVIIDAITDEVAKTVPLRTTPGLSLVINSVKEVFMNDGFRTNRGILVYDLMSEKWLHDRNDALSDFVGGSGMAVDRQDNVYVAFPDWTGGGQDELRVMGPDRTIVKTYRVGKGGSIVAIARIEPAESAQADLNNDGLVDLADLVLVGSNFGKAGAEIMGDINGDGVVDVFDLVLVSVQFSEGVAAAPVRIANHIHVSSAFISDHRRIQQAIDALEAFPDQSPAVRLMEELLRLYIAETPVEVTETQLFANYPNPFNPETWIPFQLATGSQVVIRIYSGLGQPIRSINLGYRGPGVYITQSNAAFWDGRNEEGERVASGLYFYQLLTDHLSETRKMIVLK